MKLQDVVVNKKKKTTKVVDFFNHNTVTFTKFFLSSYTLNNL